MNSTSFFQEMPVFARLKLTNLRNVDDLLKDITLLGDERMGVILEGDLLPGVLNMLSEKTKKRMEIGIKVPKNDYNQALESAREYGIHFIELDYVAGKYDRAPEGLDVKKYWKKRELAKDVGVLGGVWPWGYKPIDGSSLEDDIKEGMKRADGIVFTSENPNILDCLEKIEIYRQILGDYPLVIDVGLNLENALDLLPHANAYIIGSCLNLDNNPERPLDRRKVRGLMDLVIEEREIRRD